MSATAQPSNTALGVDAPVEIGTEQRPLRPSSCRLTHPRIYCAPLAVAADQAAEVLIDTQLI